jgi:hypothetical protein
MHGKLRESVKRGASIRENISLAIGAVIFLVLMILADRAGFPRKWRTAIFGTVVPFWATVAYSQSHWRRWPFWLSIAICFGVHSLAFWYLFKYVFVSAYPGILIWTPVVLVWTFVVFIVVMRLEQKFGAGGEQNP